MKEEQINGLFNPHKNILREIRLKPSSEKTNEEKLVSAIAIAEEITEGYFKSLSGEDFELGDLTVEANYFFCNSPTSKFKAGRIKKRELGELYDIDFDRTDRVLAIKHKEAEAKPNFDESILNPTSEKIGSINLKAKEDWSTLTQEEKVMLSIYYRRYPIWIGYFMSFSGEKFNIGDKKIVVNLKVNGLNIHNIASIKSSEIGNPFEISQENTNNFLPTVSIQEEEFKKMEIIKERAAKLVLDDKSYDIALNLPPTLKVGTTMNEDGSFSLSGQKEWLPINFDFINLVGANEIREGKYDDVKLFFMEKTFFSNKQYSVTESARILENCYLDLSKNELSFKNAKVHQLFV